MKVESRGGGGGVFSLDNVAWIAAEPYPCLILVERPCQRGKFSKHFPNVEMVHVMRRFHFRRYCFMLTGRNSVRWLSMRYII